MTMLLEQGPDPLGKVCRASRWYLSLYLRTNCQREHYDDPAYCPKITFLQPSGRAPSGSDRRGKAAGMTHRLIRPGIPKFCKPQDNPDQATSTFSSSVTRQTIRAGTPGLYRLYCESSASNAVAGRASSSLSGPFHLRLSSGLAAKVW